jgi:hypothetical protein
VRQYWYECSARGGSSGRLFGVLPCIGDYAGNIVKRDGNLVQYAGNARNCRRKKARPESGFDGLAASGQADIIAAGT